MTGPRRLYALDKLRIHDGRIYYFLYQQDGFKQPMNCLDTISNRLFIDWVQVHDAPPPKLTA
jgi:hypothetical protein